MGGADVRRNLFNTLRSTLVSKFNDSCYTAYHSLFIYSKEQFMSYVTSLPSRFLSSLKALALEHRIILYVVTFIMLTGNVAFFKRLVSIYPISDGNIPFLISLALFFTISTLILLVLICHGRATRWILAFYLIGASMAAYYMDQFSVIIDTVMFDNIRHTDSKEVAGLLNLSLFLRLTLLGILPAWIVIKYSPKSSLKTSLKSKLIFTGLLSVMLVLLVAPFTAGYANFIREHKTTRYYANPTYFTYSFINYLIQQASASPITDLSKTAEDIKKVGATSKHELMIMVVGETARADRFSLNGYKRLTNPELAKQDVISFSNVASCGTSTGVSVPCMFSVLGRKEYNKEKALHMENALDVLAKRGVEVLWRDNNSDSKGVATRMRYEDFQSPTFNPVCDGGECRDIGMLSGLDKYIESKKGKDILIVLHQMGNHGPEYYRRYPKEFEKFKPMCMTGDIRHCSQDEVDNSYDNAILYTDYFLSEIINFLKKYDDQYETAMLYVADHGESLGEHGFYLHAAPYMIAPKEQTHVPAILWLGKNFGYHIDQVKPYIDYPLSQDDVFCSLMVGFEMETKTCASKQQILMENADLKHGT
jgi:lipid A ethanolaminephosphotransferase